MFGELMFFMGLCLEGITTEREREKSKIKTKKKKENGLKKVVKKQEKQ